MIHIVVTIVFIVAATWYPIVAIVHNMVPMVHVV